jgi:small GTP-binding protein
MTYIFKYIIVGDSGVGKTAFLNEFIKKEFNPLTLPTVGLEFISKTITKQGIEYKLQIWDTAGQEDYGPITRLYYRHTTVIILAFDLCNLKSFGSVDRWYNEIIEIAHPKTKIVLVGMKHDKTSEILVSSDTIGRWLTDRGDDIFAYYDVSSVTCHHVDEVFFESMDKIISELASGQIDLEEGVEFGIRFQKPKDWGVSRIFGLGASEEKKNFRLGNSGEDTFGIQMASSDSDRPGDSCGSNALGCSNGTCCI